MKVRTGWRRNKKERMKNVLNLKKSSRIAIVCAVVLVAAVGFGLMTNRAQPDDCAAENQNGDQERISDVYSTADTENYTLSEISDSYNQYANPETPVGNNEGYEKDYIIIESLFAVGASAVEGATVRLLISGPFLPIGWHLSNIDLGGRKHHLYHEFETHEIMLNPYTIAIEYVVVDTPWTRDAEMVLMEYADLMFDHFEELLAVSFRVQKIERADGMTNYKNAQLTRERVPINEQNTWCHVDYYAHLIPFYVNVDMYRGISVTFQWVPAGFELYEVESIINSLPFDELGLQIEFIRVMETWLQYGPHVYSIDIRFIRPQNIKDVADIGDELISAITDKAIYLFDIFHDLMIVTYYFDLSDHSSASFEVRPFTNPSNQ